METTPLFEKQYKLFFKEFGIAKKMVLSTSLACHVTSRTMSIIQIDDFFYFQTDRTFRKYAQLLENPNVSLCIDNIQIEGRCKEMGHPKEHPRFLSIYEKAFPHSFKLYSSLQNERLFQIEPTFIERWIYQNDIPFIETFDLKTKRYCIEKYTGV